MTSETRTRFKSDPHAPNKQTVATNWRRSRRPGTLKRTRVSLTTTVRYTRRANNVIQVTFDFQDSLTSMRRNSVLKAREQFNTAQRSTNNWEDFMPTTRSNAFARSSLVPHFAMADGKVTSVALCRQRLVNANMLPYNWIYEFLMRRVRPTFKSWTLARPAKRGSI